MIHCGVYQVSFVYAVATNTRPRRVGKMWPHTLPQSGIVLLHLVALALVVSTRRWAHQSSWSMLVEGIVQHGKPVDAVVSH